MDQRFYGDPGRGDQYYGQNRDLQRVEGGYDNRAAYPPQPQRAAFSGGQDMRGGYLRDGYSQNRDGFSQGREQYSRNVYASVPRDLRQMQPQNAQPSQNPFGYGGYESGNAGIIIHSPTTYRDIQMLIDQLKLRQQVIVDFSTVNRDAVYRALDFMSGAIYALGGSIKQISQNIFLFAPAGVTITIPPQLSRR